MSKKVKSTSPPVLVSQIIIGWDSSGVALGSFRDENVTKYFSQGEKSMNCTPGWLNLAIQPNLSPPQSATPLS